MEVISKKRKVSENLSANSPVMQKELVRLMVQALYDLGYNKAAEQLEVDSGVQLEAIDVKNFREGILSGNWDLATNIVPTLEITQKNEQKIKFHIKEQKYFELLSEGNYRSALDTLRSEITPLHDSSKDLHELAGLLLCKNSEELKENSNIEYDRKKVLDKLQSYIPPDIMIPSDRLKALVGQALEYQMYSCEKHCGFFKADSLLVDHSCDSFNLPSVAEAVVNESCEVWDAVFSHSGEQVAVLCKTSYFSIWKVLIGEKVCTGISDVSGVAWALDDKTIATGSLLGIVNIWCATQGTHLYSLKDHTEKVTSCMWIGSEQLLTGAIDRKLILWDNKNKSKTWEIRVRQIEKSLSGCIIAVLNASKPEVQIFSYNPIEKICVINEEESITSIQINKAGNQLLTVVSLTPPKMHLWSITGSLLQTFEGFKQERFILRPTFAGPNDDLVLIGSEDGYVFVWSKVQGSKLGVFKGHGSTVNTVAIHPKSPNLVITTSDDGSVKMWNLMPKLGSIV
ncbi:hypothetical protein SteCoe_16866 [Stentor coeruleus]|uniref:CTLH domain-containing protein n=1 Tax=Stentor coeruleus TaxID=5963 RepID=A0A1R2C0F2_9CILI|nr:hypothetical protein SteCoe_16866 [Stentor coeruleus]